MLKFLRKYNKWILAVFGSLLMVVFLIPQALQRLAETAGRGGAKLATIDGEKVTNSDYERAQRDLRVVESTQFRQQLPFVEQAHHWYLLDREARSAGLVPAPAVLSPPSEQIPIIAVRSETSPRGVLDGIASAAGVTRMMALYGSAGQLSDRRLRRFGERLLHGVSAQVIQIQADPDAVTFEPTEQRVQEHFDKYAEIDPGEGDMGFGYRLPDRLKLEWLTIEEEAVRSSIESSDATNPIALYKYWRQHEAEAGIPTFVENAAVPAEVRRALVNSLTQERLDEIAKFAYDRLRAARRGLGNDGAFVKLPDDWRERMVSMTALAEQIQDEFGLPSPTYQSMGDEWLRIEDITTYSELARARTDKFGTRPFSLVELLPGLKEFGGDGTIPVQANVAMPPLRLDVSGQDGPIVVVRVIDADAARAPSSVDEVRDEIVRDLKRKSHYAELLDQREAIEADARSRGLLPLALDLGTTVRAAPNISICEPQLLNIYVAQGLQPQIIPSSLPGIGVHRPTVEAIIDRAMRLPFTQDVQLAPPSQRIFALPVDDRLSLYVVRLTRQNPLTEENYRMLTQNGTLQSLLLGDEFGLFDEETREQAQQAFSFEALKARHNYEVIIGDEEDAEEDELAAADGE